MFTRYAVFHTPPDGALAAFGAGWLGWDSARGAAVQHPQLDGIDVAAVTQTPRKYGLHGTLKAPFRLAEGADQAGLERAMASFAATRAPVTLDRLDLSDRFRFIALRPVSDSPALSALAEDIVRSFDRFRAPLSETEFARRKPHRLGPRLTAQLQNWGYPYIFDDFNFHMTLTGTLPRADAGRIIAALEPRLATLLPCPYPIDAITLMGEDNAGLFHQIGQYSLTGDSQPARNL